jgi:pimeloyl-ACP methyl ester carboxylesterase
MIRHRHSSSSTKDRLDLRDDESAAVVAADRETWGVTSSTSSQRGAMTNNELDKNDAVVDGAAHLRRQHILLCIVPLVILLMPCALVGWGVFLWWTELSTHDECDMTWMHPTYERIASLQHPRYSLYRYRDARDPRPTSFDPRVRPRAALLFVPGHAGSYQQVRSLGTHALEFGLTRRNVPAAELERIRKSIQRKDMVNATTTDNSPSWDVFGVDFREEPTGLHGRFVVEQSAFLADVLEFLEQSSYREVAIVAHSLGGYSTLLAVARGAEREKRRDPPLIRTIVALASPLHHPVLAWDWTLREIHQEIVNYAAKTANDNSVLVSISGGLRDEMIPPRACHAVNMGESLSLAAVDLLRPVVDEGKVPASLGMDHRAIVWCRNLLEPIVAALNVLHAGGSSPDNKVSWKKRLLRSWPRMEPEAGHSLKDYSYDDAVRRNYAELRVRAFSLSNKVNH